MSFEVEKFSHILSLNFGKRLGVKVHTQNDGFTTTTATGDSQLHIHTGTYLNRSSKLYYKLADTAKESNC